MAKARARPANTELAPVRPPVSPSITPASVPATCASCAYFIETDISAGRGVCGRYPPIVLSNDDGTATASNSQHKRWPLVFITEWCGEYNRK